MTDNEIKKALECCVDIRGGRCSECQFYKVNACQEGLCEKALDLINRQEAEIERLKEEYKQLEARSLIFKGGVDFFVKKAIKDFADRLKAKMRNCSMYCIDEQTYYLISYSLVDNLVKEMTEQRKEDGNGKATM